MLKVLIDQLDKFKWDQLKLEAQPFVGEVEGNDGIVEYHYLGQWLIEYSYFTDRDMLRLALQKKPLLISVSKVKKNLETFLKGRGFKYEFFET